ncbi:Predicted arabinose efflux permease, MFS family [Gracilibacillus orientalis]|uniref:Predicted arabinose efflux permease, MFS family n=1 Tax=Gracilibacillus orientalis TaxID=334253 RepID=A0A1I4GWH8_9BACI|nr:MFS transporter [Gracilibacillus orientalis]SFL34378.1 Predicted arabinose efflux permease, MFS family [Gracilibacillus orientalis]
MSESKIWTRNFISIAVVNLFVFISFYTLLTTLPLYVIDEWGGSEAQGGLVVTVMLLAAILLRPFAGNILTRYGKRNVLLISSILFAITMIFYLFIDSYLAMLLLRFIHGFSFAILTTATNAMAADIIPAKKRGEGLGYFTMSMNLAIVLGPFLGLSIIQFTSYTNLFIILNLFTILSVVSIFFVQTKDVKNTDKSKGSPFKWKELLEKEVLSISFIGLLVAFAYSSIVSFISVYANARGLDHVSGYFFVVFAVTMLISRPFLGKQFDLRGAKPVIIPCMILFSLGLVILSFSSHAVAFLIAAGVIGVGYGSLLPFFLSLAVSKVKMNRSGHATATFYTLYDTGIALGSLILGMIIKYIGFSQMFTLLSIFVLLILFIFIYLNKKL